jgi:hypothetical protein
MSSFLWVYLIKIRTFFNHESKPTNQKTCQSNIMPFKNHAKESAAQRMQGMQVTYQSAMSTK